MKNVQLLQVGSFKSKIDLKQRPGKVLTSTGVCAMSEVRGGGGRHCTPHTKKEALASRSCRNEPLA